MKIRQGFVSNSSTSSFMIYGAFFRFDKLCKNKKFIETIKKIAEKDGYNISDIEELSYKIARDVGTGDIINEMLGDSFLCCEEIPEEQDVYIGQSWDDIGDDETGREFKLKITEELRAIFGKDVVCDTHKEAFANYQENTIKYRSGFVSNSSTSSFVIIGYELPEDYEIDERKIAQVLLDKEDFEIAEEWEDHIHMLRDRDYYLGTCEDDGGKMIGIVVQESDDCGNFDSLCISIKNSVEEAEKIKKLLDLPVEDVKIITGTRGC